MFVIGKVHEILGDRDGDRDGKGKHELCYADERHRRIRKAIEV